MKRLLLLRLAQRGGKCWFSFLGAVTFYTCIPIPVSWPLNFRGIARWAPTVGLLIGGILAVVDAALQQLGMPILTCTALVVVSWVAVTGGLHLDGVMDTADGLAVQDEHRRLEVMTDSATGAFGAMAATALLLLKTTALTDIETYRWLALITAAAWGRWGQVVAIGFYPYLKPTGKGAFHKEAIQLPQDILGGFILLLGLGGLPWWLDGDWWSSLAMVVVGCSLAIAVGAWFHRQLGGHTGDTYGAVVEWTEALFLCFLTTIWG
ncbi:adenosylcobinamide-GDP ribazoletransferase [Lyngbya aestuarii]|uniref:adenosylcobinamide-GDP ribazoletransferase n=1 Tax=Lyngbya aestuarii TaxID=118322 RepID=UPI00403D8BDE